MTKTKHIPIHRIKNETNIGMEIHCVGEMKVHDEGKTLGIHRDDHYIFFLTEKGEGSLTVDFTEINICGRALYYILPGQVHHVLNAYHASGWFVAADTSLVPPHYREIFENQLCIQQPYPLNDEQFKQCESTAKLLHQQFESDREQPFYTQLLYSLLNTFIGYVATGYCNSNQNSATASRPYQITQQFKKLLRLHFVENKSPTWYADQLMISESYLNEALKKTTGFSVTYWITHEIVLEAKRLLHYSQLNVKEIAHTLGYDDHTYFSRLFKRSAQQTPLEFRAEYHK
ncbi:helix-turn-helix transcriptional regulator [Mucilaginibacter sp. JRF]|uniref:helix-turn-helix domain-containing protein n=1 Tax=Mucilaginibacter sp. JRF TaxID=2780088 RepID=UPI00188221D5|nr:AraC family transcriptional regulator [Mucilaginibacter sp. JRF]MBE9583551.1 helix-turn-helix transcriptional regulator [Mucilaginibacter sp. JRF]